MTVNRVVVHPTRPSVLNLGENCPMVIHVKVNLSIHNSTGPYYTCIHDIHNLHVVHVNVVVVLQAAAADARQEVFCK